MDFAGLTPDLIAQLGFAGVVSYGAVGVIGMWRKDLTTQQKVLLLGAIAFIVSFIPADFGNIILNHLKVALAVAFGMTATSTVANKIGGK